MAASSRLGIPTSLYAIPRRRVGIPPGQTVGVILIQGDAKRIRTREHNVQEVVL